MLITHSQKNSSNHALKEKDVGVIRTLASLSSGVSAVRASRLLDVVGAAAWIR
jgi:hypothetical protein